MKKSSEIVKKNKKKYNCKYYNSSFATILRDFLEMKEFNQQKLAEELKVSRQTISLYANGNSLPDIETLKKIIKYFKKNKYDYSSDYWLGLISEPSSDIKIKTINKKYGLSEESLNEIKHSSEYLKDNLNYFLEHIGLLEVTIKSKDYTDISEALNRLSFLLYIEHLSDYIIDKLKLNEKDKLKNFFNYCNQNNEAIFDLLLSYKVDYMPIYQNFKDLYNSIFVEEESFTSQKEKKIKNILKELGNKYYTINIELTDVLKIKRLDLIEKMQYFLDGIRYSNKIEIGSKEFSKLFGENEKELEKYLGNAYKNNKKFFENKYIPFL